METVGIDMLDILIKEGPGWNISKEFLEGVKVAKEIMEAEGYYNLTDWDAMSYKDQIREVMTYCSNVSIQEGKKKDQVKEETSFDWNCFSEKDFARLQREQNAEIYGCVKVIRNDKRYLVDIEWEAKYAYDRDGFSLNVYESDAEWNHVYPFGEDKSINFSKNYERFKRRAEKAILEMLMDD